jgi:hypothetical protein
MTVSDRLAAIRVLSNTPVPANSDNLRDRVGRAPTGADAGLNRVWTAAEHFQEDLSFVAELMRLDAGWHLVTTVGGHRFLFGACRQSDTESVDGYVTWYRAVRDRGGATQP